MDLTVDLNRIPFQQVLPIIRWCLEHSIDRDKCIRMLDQWHESAPVTTDWILTIPGKYATMFLLKWPFEDEQ